MQFWMYNYKHVYVSVYARGWVYVCARRYVCALPLSVSNNFVQEMAQNIDKRRWKGEEGERRGQEEALQDKELGEVLPQF